MSLVIVGGGGHAKVVVEIFRQMGEPVLGIIDRRPTTIGGLPYLGDDGVWDSLYDQGVRRAHVAVGDNELRTRLADVLLARGISLVSAIDPRAYLASSVVVGFGSAVMAGAVVQPDCNIGALSIINTKASVDHDGVIGRGVHIGPGATLAGSVEVGDLTFIGAGATVIPGVRIGKGSVIGAGSCVIKGIGDNLIAYGVPARPIKSRRP